MPTLQLKTIPFTDGAGTLDYKEIVTLAVKNPSPQKGPDGQTIPGSFDFDELFTALELKRKIRNSNGELKLDKDETAYVVKRIRSMQWFTADDAIGEFLTDVVALEDQVDEAEDKDLVVNRKKKA